MKTVKAVAPYIHPGFLNFKTAPYEAWVKNANGNDNGNENVNDNLNENENLNDNDNRGGYNYICTKVDGKFMFTNEQLVEAMGDAKVTIALPRSVTDPDVAGDIETLTQRYWECMLSRIVMVGHAPKELTELIGYNPVIEINGNENDNINDNFNENENSASKREQSRAKFNANENETLRYDNEDFRSSLLACRAQRGKKSDGKAYACVEKRSKNEKGDIFRQIKGVLEHIEDYQALVDKNRETALKIGDWNVRMKQVIDWLKDKEYSL